MNMNPLAQFSAQQLRQAADLMEQITALQDKLGQMIGEPKPAPVATAAKATKPTSKFSAAAKAALSAKLKAYWAKRKKGLQAASPAAASAVRSRPKMSAAGRARLVASAKARWARAKAAGQKTL